MENDFMQQDNVISGTDISIQPQASQGTKFLSTFLGGLMQGGGGQEAKMKKEKDKLSYYTELRKSGYSPEEATKRVNKQSSGGFLNKVLGKTDAGFQAPSGANDTFTADAQAKAAKAKLETAQAGWYNRRSGQSSGTGGSGDTERMKALQKMIQEAQDGLATAQKENSPDQQTYRKRIGKYQKTLDKLVGAGDEEQGSSGSGAAQQAYVPGQTQVGQTFKHTNGKTYKVVDISDPNDPGVEEVSE